MAFSTLALLAAIQLAAAVQWTSIGCYTDSSTSRTLMAKSFVSGNMTVESCQEFCASSGYSLSGLEVGTQCYCDYALQSSGALTSAASCATPCSGNATEQCGGSNTIKVYSNGAPSPVAPAQVGSWQYQGCFADSVSSRALPHQMFISSGVTIESCTSACKSNGFGVAGLEFAGECFCSSSLPTSTHLNDNDCHTACTANTTEFCGGSNTLTVYEDVAGEICLATTLATSFNLEAVFMTPPTTGPPSVPLHIDLVNTVVLVSWSILTTVNGVFDSIILTNGGLLPMSTSQPNFRTSSLAIVPGDSPTFVTTQFPPTPFPDYCIMANPVNGSAGNTLALNNRNDLFALCPNSTAGNRQDVVFSPRANHPHYTLASCNPVYIVLTP